MISIRYGHVAAVMAADIFGGSGFQCEVGGPTSLLTPHYAQRFHAAKTDKEA